MLLPDHQYLKADSLESCLQRLSENAATTQLVAGGTDVIFNMRLKLFKPDVALSIRSLKDLQKVEETGNGGLRLGAGCQLEMLEHDPLILERYPALAEAIAAVASTHLIQFYRAQAQRQ